MHNSSNLPILRPSTPRAKRVRQQTLPPMDILIGATILVVIVLMGIIAVWKTPYPPNQTHFNATFQPPSPLHWLGTDALGRDVLSRILYGTNASLLVSVGGIALALAMGTTLGLIAGFWSGSFLDEVTMRLMDAILVIPALVLALALDFLLGSGLIQLTIVIGVVFTPQFARIIRGKTLTVRTLAFVEAASALGASAPRILWRHILPSVIQPALVLATLNVGSAIILQASLAYLGLGLEPPYPSWGFMVSSNVNYLAQAPWLVFAPSGAIALSVYATTLLGQGAEKLHS